MSKKKVKVPDDDKDRETIYVDEYIKETSSIIENSIKERELIENSNPLKRIIYKLTCGWLFKESTEAYNKVFALVASQVEQPQPPSNYALDTQAQVEKQSSSIEPQVEQPQPKSAMKKTLSPEQIKINIARLEQVDQSADSRKMAMSIAKKNKNPNSEPEEVVPLKPDVTPIKGGESEVNKTV